MRRNCRFATLILACLFSQQPFSPQLLGQSSTISSGNVSAPFGTRFPDGHPDQRFIGQLIERGLFDTAITISQRRRSLAESGQNSNEKYHWRMLCMETAAAKTAAQIGKYFDSLTSLDSELKSIADSIPLEKDDPRSLWIQYKSTWCQWYVLRSGVSSYLAAPNRGALQDWCLQRIHIALDELEELEFRVEKTPTTGTSSIDKIGANDLSSLIAEVNLLACDLLSLRGMIYPERSDERLAAGTQMLTVIDKAEKRIGPTWADRPKIQIAKCRALLLTGRPQDALAAATALFSSSPLRREWVVSIAAIASEAARVLGDFDSALRWIREGGGWESHPLLAIEQFATTLAKEQTGSIDEALRIKKAIAERFGGYWASRTDALLVSTKSNKSSMPNGNMGSNALAIELLLSEVKQLMASKRWEDAIEKLSQGEMIAATQKNEGLAIQMAMKSAAIWGSLNDFANAANEFHRAAMIYPKVTQAPGASMTAILMIQHGLKRLETEATADSQEQRDSLLELRKQIWLDVLSVWPESEQAKAALDSLQNFYLSNDQLWETGQLWMSRWELLQRNSKERVVEEVELKSAFQHSLHWSTLMCMLTQQSWLDRSLVGVDARTKSSELLARFRVAVQSSGRVDQIAWNAEFKTMETGIGWEWVGTSRSNFNVTAPNALELWLECELLYMQLLSSTQPSPEKIVQLNELVDRLAIATEKEGKTKLGKGTKEQLTRSITLYRIAIDGWNGDVERAKQELEKREKDSNRSAWWLYQSARWMQSIPSLREESLVRFRRIASGLPSGSEGWFETRARTVQTLRMLQRTEEANQLATVIVATSPSIESHWMKRIEANK